jgi:quercetin dioxygenase-like cupin family protein
MAMKTRLIVALCAAGVAAGAWGSPVSTKLLEARSTWNGDEIEYFRTRCPEVDAVIVDIPAGEATPVHLHPVNNYAYVLRGTVHLEELAVVDGKLVVRSTRDFKQGDAFAELVNTWHRGTAGPEGVEILVWYTGEAGYPSTVAYSPDHRIDADLEDHSRCAPQRPRRRATP